MRKPWSNQFLRTNSDVLSWRKVCDSLSGRNPNFSVYMSLVIPRALLQTNINTYRHYLHVRFKWENSVVANGCIASCFTESFFSLAKSRFADIQQLAHVRRVFEIACVRPFSQAKENLNKNIMLRKNKEVGKIQLFNYGKVFFRPWQAIISGFIKQ